MSSSDNPQFEPQQPGIPESGVPESAATAPEAPPAPEQPRIPIGFHPAADPSAAIFLPPAGPTPQKTPPIENPPWTGWDVVVIACLAFATIFVSQFVILFGAHYFLYPHKTLAELAERPMLLLIAQLVVDGAVALYLVLLVEGKYHVRFWPAIRWDWSKAGWKLLGLGAAMMLGLSLLENFLPLPKDTPFDKLFASPRDAYLVALFAVTLGPFVEELFFRGFLYPVLERRWGIAWAVFLTALPFGLMHLPQYGWAWGAGLIILIVGIVCGVVRAVTRSVAASFLVHVGYNGMQMIIAIWYTHGFTQMPKGLLGPWFH